MKLKVKRSEKIFAEGEFFPKCHASTLVKLDNGIIICAWFGGSYEKNDDVAIWYSILKDGKWSDPKVAADTPNIPCWNPVLFSPDKKRVILYFKSGKQIPEWKTYTTISDDSGKTWTEPLELVKGDIGGRGPVKNKPIRASNGWIIAPASIERPGEFDAFVDISKDNGSTWEKSPLVPLDHSKLSGKGVIQPTLWESTPGNIHMLLRSSEKKIYRSDSTDYGVTWCKAYKTDMPNNNSGIDLVRLYNKELLLICNPVGENWGKRSPLSIFSSNDNGKSWTKQLVADKDDNPDCEFSYPSMIAEGNNVYTSYTWNRRSVSFMHLSVE